MKGNASAGAAAQQGDTTKAAHTVATAPAVNWGREFESITALVNQAADKSDTTLARQALTRLNALDAAATPDSTYLQYRYLRAQALMVTDSKVGCDSLVQLEGRLNTSRFNRSASPLLTFCRQ